MRKATDTAKNDGRRAIPISPNQILLSPLASVAARVLVTFTFWMSGITKLVWWQSGVGTMSHFHLNPPALFNAATVLTQLIGTALIIWGRRAWLGVGMLIVFIALTIPIAQPFWGMDGGARHSSLMVVFEHITVMGGLLAIAIMRALEAEREKRA